MNHTRHRSGFTLIEAMIATAISALVLASTLNFFIGTQRTFKLAFARSELAFQSHLLREKLLFRALPSNGDYLCGGFLSVNINDDLSVEDGHLTARIKALKPIKGFGCTDFETALTLSVNSIGSSSANANAAKDPNPRWLRPGGFEFFTTQDKNSATFEKKDNDALFGNALFINLQKQIDVAGISVEQKARVRIPSFIRKQQEEGK